MKSRRMIIAVLLFVAVAVSSATFAFWASGVTGNNDTATGTVTIGEGDAVTTTVNVNNESDDGPLVPVNNTGTNDVDLTFNVDWTGQGATGATGTLSVNVESIEVDSVDKSNLFSVTVTSGTGAITAGTAQPVVVNVEFANEPADQSEYNEVVNGEVIVTLTYTVAAD